MNADAALATAPPAEYDADYIVVGSGAGGGTVAARLAEAAGLKVVMNRCPKIELFRPFWKPRLQQTI